MNIEADLSEALQGDSVNLAPTPVKVYKLRYWILFLYAALGFMQCAVWNTWGPITISVETAYNWTDGTIALLSMWGTITMVLGLIPFTYMLENIGMRRSIFITSLFIASGTCVRLWSTDKKFFTFLAHLGSILNGFGGIVIGIAPSKLSSLWFPPNERTTATAIACTFNQLGNAGGFLLGPLLVNDPNNSTTPSGGIVYPADLRRQIYDYLWIVFGICAAIFILVWYKFPSKPKKPPSVTSARKNQNMDSFGKQFLMLGKNKNFWLILIPYSLTLGVNVAWSSVIDINMDHYGISQAEAGWMGVWVTIGGVAMAVVVARLTDYLFGYIKLTIIILLMVATSAFTWFLFLTNGWLEVDKTQLFVSIIIASSFSYGCSPLFFELAVELAYPVSEAIVGCYLNFGWNVTAGIFLGVIQLMDGVVWMDYVLALQGFLSVIIMIIVKEEYRRTFLDRVATTVEAEDDDDDEDTEDDIRAVFSRTI